MTADHLPVPDAATHAFAEAIIRGYPADGPEYRRAVCAIAGPVVGEVLRYEADAADANADASRGYGFDATADFHAYYARYLRDRADEIDPSGGGQP